MSSFIPESAPFNEQQRAWLNGFFAGLVGLPNADASAAEAAIGLMPGQPSESSAAVVEEEAEEFPWHDASLPIVDRMALAEEQPLSRKLMAAMAQLDCGSCGYLCQTYGEAIAAGEETNLTLCSPGGKETKRMIKDVLRQSPAVESSEGSAKDNGAAGGGFGRKNPFTARLIESRPLNKEGSAKDTRHVVIDLQGSGLTYEVGDALGVFPSNCRDLAATVVQRLAADPQVQVSAGAGDRKPLIEALCDDCCLKDPTDELLELLIGRVDDAASREQLTTMLEEGVADGVDVLDLLEIAAGVMISATEFVETLSPMNPRLYSIASSMRHVGEQVHLTVGKVVYEREGRQRKGVASTMLADRVRPGETVRVFVSPNHGGFTVPSDPAAPMIMVGPGTGIAPFMAFLQEREASASTGHNWLFFGDQHQACDFLYEDELRGHLASGILTRLDAAFSRDGEQKVYVQDRLREHGEELWMWLQRGSHFYVCGDASRMAADVDRALTDICSLHGGMSLYEAKRYVSMLAADRRYVRDVY